MMGTQFSSFTLESIFQSFDWIWQSYYKETGLLILGLDSAGKTAILYSMQLGEAINYTVPTIGFNVEEVEIANVKIQMFDIGGQDAIRALWPHYYQQCHGIVFVVDSNDHERFQLARDELHATMSHIDNVGKPLVVLANKQDLPYATSKEKLTTALNLDTISSSEWYIIECSATTNQQARIGFEWLANHV